MTRRIVVPAGGDADTLAEVSVNLGKPAPDQVRVSVRASGVNPVDWKSLDRQAPSDSAVPVGYEAAGLVTDLGTEAAPDGTITLGTEVIAYPVPGCYASDLLAPRDEVVAKPSTLDFSQAANLLLVGTAAAEMLHVTEVRGGETVVVHGASSATGLSLLQQAAVLGLRTIATASPANHDLVRAFGGEPVTYGPGLEQRLRALRPDGVDAAFDCVGTEEALQVSLALTRERRRIVSIAARERAPVLGIRFIDGVDPDSLAYRNAARHRVVALAGEGSLTVPMARSLPLSAAPEAFAVLRGGHPGGKLALVP